MSERTSLKVFLSVDMEGISGIVDGAQVGRDKQAYEVGRKLMVADANAAIEGALKADATEIIVSDGHGNMRNMNHEELHEAAVYVSGPSQPLRQMEGIGKGFDAALFIGYHAKRGTKNGVLAHTITGAADKIIINGLEVGETAINAAIAGYFDVPLVFLSGDLAVTQEAKSLIPNITTVAVKEGISRAGAKCLSPKTARKLIKQGVIEALKKRESIEPFIFKPPIEMKIKYTNSLIADTVEFMPFIERIDGRTVRFVFDDYIKAFRAARASLYIASAVSR